MAIAGARHTGSMKVVWLPAGREAEWHAGGRCGAGVGDRPLLPALPCVALLHPSSTRASVFLLYLYIQVGVPEAPSEKPQKQQEQPATVCPPPGDLRVEDLGAPSMDQAAVKIQAAFKGYKVRKELKQQEGPVFCRTFGDVEAQVGDVLRLECVVSSKADVHARWLKDGVELTDGRHYHIDQLGDGTCSLLVAGLGHADAGHYTCQVSSKFGHVSHSARVVVSGTESEAESSSGGELDDAFRRAARRLHRLFCTKGSAEVSDEEIFLSADEGTAEPEEPGDWQTYHEDEHCICIRFEEVAEAQQAATRFQEMFGTMGIGVDISLLEQRPRGVEMRIGRVAPAPAAPPETVPSLLTPEAGESASHLNWGGERGRAKLSTWGVGWAQASGRLRMQPTGLGRPLTLGLDRAQLTSHLCL